MTRRPPRSTLFPYPPLFRSADTVRALRPRRPCAHLHGRSVAEPDGGPSARARRALGGHRSQHEGGRLARAEGPPSGSATDLDRKSTRLNSSHLVISYAVFCL